MPQDSDGLTPPEGLPDTVAAELTELSSENSETQSSTPESCFNIERNTPSTSNRTLGKIFSEFMNTKDD